MIIPNVKHSFIQKNSLSEPSLKTIENNTLTFSRKLASVQNSTVSFDNVLTPDDKINKPALKTKSSLRNTSSPPMLRKKTTRDIMRNVKNEMLSMVSPAQNPQSLAEKVEPPADNQQQNRQTENKQMIEGKSQEKQRVQNPTSTSLLNDISDDYSSVKANDELSANVELYKLNRKQFESLYSDTVDNATFVSLENSATDGNADCISLLLNLALRQDQIGNRAEKIIFDLFSGKEHCDKKQDLDEHIQEATLELYQLMGNKNEETKKLHSPSRLLYIVGSATNKADKQEELTKIFTAGQQAQSQHEKIGDKNLWSNNRMLTSDEIYASLINIEKQHKNVSVNYPLPLINPSTKQNELSTQIAQKMASGGIDKVEFFPVNTDGHWISLAIYKDRADRNTTKAVIFNSNGFLDADKKGQIFEALSAANVIHDNFKCIEYNLQNSVPNGCGLFVNEALKAIVNHADPVSAWKAFVSDFNKLSEPEKFNIERRRQIYEHSIK